METYFHKEQIIVEACFSNRVELHHIGRTAVTGLCSKDCVDILGVTSKLPSCLDAVEPLEILSYQYKGEYGIKGRHYFLKHGASKPHLHICVSGHEQIQRHLHFVEVMSRNPYLVEELNQLKLSLANRFP